MTVEPLSSEYGTHKTVNSTFWPGQLRPDSGLGFQAKGFFATKLMDVPHGGVRGVRSPQFRG